MESERRSERAKLAMLWKLSPCFCFSSSPVFLVTLVSYRNTVRLKGKELDGFVLENERLGSSCEL